MEPFNPTKMQYHYPVNSYESPDRKPCLFARLFPSVYFYSKAYLAATYWLVKKARAGLCDGVVWEYASNWILEAAETTGIKVRVEGLDLLKRAKPPYVIASNHMSTLETFLLPGMLRPRFPVTFVVKRSLVEGNCFGAVMRSRRPVVLDRKNPREDLATVLREGCDRLSKGMSVIVFPQSTRRRYFDEKEYNTIAEKLARKAGVPLVPLAVKTDCWGQGNLIRQLGRITPNHEALFRFFPPIEVKGNGHPEHAAVVEVLKNTTSYWESRQEAMDRGEAPRPFLDPNFKLPELFETNAPQS